MIINRSFKIISWVLISMMFLMSACSDDKERTSPVSLPGNQTALGLQFVFPASLPSLKQPSLAVQTFPDSLYVVVKVYSMIEQNSFEVESYGQEIIMDSAESGVISEVRSSF